LRPGPARGVRDARRGRGGRRLGLNRLARAVAGEVRERPTLCQGAGGDRFAAVKSEKVPVFERLS